MSREEDLVVGHSVPYISWMFVLVPLAIPLPREFSDTRSQRLHLGRLTGIHLEDWTLLPTRDKQI